MAFNWQTFKTRALTAIVFVVVMMAGLLWNRWSFFVLFSIVHFGAWVEYQKLVGKISQQYAPINAMLRYGAMLPVAPISLEQDPATTLWWLNEHQTIAIADL